MGTLRKLRALQIILNEILATQPGFFASELQSHQLRYKCKADRDISWRPTRAPTLAGTCYCVVNDGSDFTAARLCQLEINFQFFFSFSSRRPSKIIEMERRDNKFTHQRKYDNTIFRHDLPDRIVLPPLPI